MCGMLKFRYLTNTISGVQCHSRVTHPKAILLIKSHFTAFKVPSEARADIDQ